MQQISYVQRLVAEMIGIVVIALTARFLGFAQSSLESGLPLTMARVWQFFLDVLGNLARGEGVLLLVATLAGASLFRIGLQHANRSMLCRLKEEAGIDNEDLSWRERVVRFPLAVLYRTINGIATLVGAIALALCFKLFDPDKPFGFTEIEAYARPILTSLTSGSAQAILLLFLLFAVVATLLGHIASPFVLSVDEMAKGHPGGDDQPKKDDGSPRRQEQRVGANGAQRPTHAA